MKNFFKKLPYILIGVFLTIAGTVYAVVSVPNSTQKGNYLSGLLSGNYQTNVPCSNGQVLSASSTSSSGWACTVMTSGSGSGVPSTTPFTSGYIPMATGTNVSLTNSNIFQLGSNIGIGTTSPSEVLQVSGGSVLLDNNGSYKFKNSVGSSFLALLTDSSNDLILNSQGASSPLLFRQGGNERMRIDTSGNVGIGTTSPNSKLQVIGTDSQPSSAALTGGAVSFGASGTQLVFDIADSWSPYAASIQHKSRTLDSTYYPIALNPLGGNVGIGMTSPAQKLEVSALTGVPAVSGTTQNGIFRISRSDTSANVLDFGVMGTSPNAAWMQATYAPNLGVYYPIALNPNGGNVGVGTTAPGTILDVVGSTGIRSYFSGSDGRGLVTIGNNNINNTSAYLTMAASNTQKNWQIATNFSTAGDFVILPSTATGGTTFTTPALVIKNDGNVGIGTTAPANKLEVNGKMQMDDWIVGSTGQNAFYANGTGGSTYFQQPTSGDMQFRKSDGTVYMEILNTGNVGIGTTGPVAPLDVRTVDAGVGSQTITGIFGRTGAAASGTKREAGIVFSDADNQTLTAGITGIRDNSSGNFQGGLGIYINESLSTPAAAFSDMTRVMTIDKLGDVGIGTSSPSQALQVNGSALLGVQNTTKGTLLFANSANAYTTTLQASSTQAASLTFTLPVNSGTAGQFLQTDGSGVMSWINGSGLTLNGLTGTTQTFATSTGGSLWTITSSGTAHTWNIPATPTFTGITTTNASTTGLSVNSLSVFADFDKSFSSASTTPDYQGNSFSTATFTVPSLWNPSRQATMTRLFCKTDVGTLLLNFGGTLLSCTTSGASSTPNTTFSQYGDIKVQLGTRATAPNNVGVTATFHY